MSGGCGKSGLGDETEESGTSKTGPRKGLEREEIRGSKASPVIVLPNEQRHIGQNEKLRKLRSQNRGKRKIEDERRVVESGPQSPHVEIEDRLDRLFLSVIGPLDLWGPRVTRQHKPAGIRSSFEELACSEARNKDEQS